MVVVDEDERERMKEWVGVWELEGNPFEFLGVKKNGSGGGN